MRVRVAGAVGYVGAGGVMVLRPRPCPAIEIVGLEKRYGANRAVDGVSFAVEEGEVFALLGPNGAGKTTTLEILEGHRRRDGGEVSVLGFDPESGGRAFRERIWASCCNHEPARLPRANGPQIECARRCRTRTGAQGSRGGRLHCRDVSAPAPRR